MEVNDPSASFGGLLRDHRRAAGLTQEELAERAGVSPRSISEWERGGAHVPRRDTVALLVRALDLHGPDRAAFEALVDHRRRPRPLPDLDTTPMTQVPPAAGRAVARAKHNLPRSLSSFIGREHELIELARDLPDEPLLTLVGPGGVGKTRLAQELARTLFASYADGGWLAELAGLTDPAQVQGAVAAAVGLRDVPVRTMRQTLTEYLQPKHLLLVLDNCEHLVEACAELVAHLLRTCPRLHVLATSREPLGVSGEITWRVPPLELPDPRHSQSAEQILQTAAVRLFVERARSVNNTLILTDDNAPTIARICIGVDGIPLALELAAARVRVLSLEQLAARLEDDFGVLGGANRGSLPQHQTLRATIDWSHDLLAEPEQVLLRRLSVFACGWTLQLAEAVCSGAGIEPAGVLDLLTQLVDKSMALADATDAAARYRLLEPIRQYALERLETSGEATAYRARHAAAFLKLAWTGEADPSGPDEIAVLDRFEVEHENIRAALRWALGNQDSAAALRAAAALFDFWERRGHFAEGRAWLEQALAAAGDTRAPSRARALNGLVALRLGEGDADRARPIAEQALAVSREAGDASDVAWALLNLSLIPHYHQRTSVAVGLLEESVQCARQAGRASLLSLSLTFLGGALLWARGPTDQRAAAVLEESLALAVAAQARYATGHALVTFGDLVWQQGDAERAMPLWRHALAVRWQLSDRRGIAGCTERLAWGLAASDEFAPAAWLFGAAEAQRTLLGFGLRHDLDTDHAHLLDVTRQHLGGAFAETWSGGRAATVDEAVIRALESTQRLLDASPVSRLAIVAS